MNLIVSIATTCLLMTVCGSIGAETLQVPFQLKRNVIVISTRVNGSDPLDLILDTGMPFDGVYLFSSKILGSIDTSRMMQVQVPGAGSSEPSTALMIEDGTLSFGDVSVESQRVIISTSSYTQSFPTDGVIGWSLFGHYVVGIDYDAGTITLSGNDFVRPDTSWQEIPITLRKNIPFLDGVLGVAADETTQVALYVDLASGEALELLTRPDQKFRLPDSLTTRYLGTGLSGDIYGSFGRSRFLRLGDYTLNDVPTAFASAAVRSKQEGADGIIGNNCLRRFNAIFDYPHSRLFVKANRTFSLPFEPDIPDTNRRRSTSRQSD